MATFLYNTKDPIGYYSWQFQAGRQLGFTVTCTPYGYTLTSLILRLANYGNPSGTFTVSLYDTVLSGAINIPTGSALETSSINQSAITSFPYSAPWVPDGELHTFSLSTTLQPDTAYAIMFTASGYDGSNFTGVGASTLGITGSGASGGSVYYSGSAWQTWTTSTPIFQLSGDVIIPRDPERPDADTVTFPASRPDVYAPDDVWKPGEWSGGVFTPGDWATPGTDRYFATGGGRWNQQLVVCGNGQVYYEAL